MAVRDKLANLQRELNDLTNSYTRRKDELIQQGAKLAESRILPEVAKARADKDALERDLKAIIQAQEREISNLKNTTFDRERRDLQNQIQLLQKERDEARRELEHIKTRLKSDITSSIQNNKRQLDEITGKLGRRLSALSDLVRRDPDKFFDRGLSAQVLREIEIGLMAELKATQNSNNNLANKLSSL